MSAIKIGGSFNDLLLHSRRSGYELSKAQVILRAMERVEFEIQIF